MQKMVDYDGYKIVPTDWGYYVTISSTDANKCISYEYDGHCATREELDKFLSEHSFDEVRKAFREQFVYCECVEEIC